MQLNAAWSRHTIAVGEVTTLDHKVLDHTVESRALITKTLLASSQSTNGGLVYAKRGVKAETEPLAIPEVLSGLFKHIRCQQKS